MRFSRFNSRRVTRSFDSTLCARKVICEALEDRQLLSLTVDLRANDGSKTVDVASVGQVVQLQAWGVVTGNNADPTQDGLFDVSGSFVSNGFSAGSVAGNLTDTNMAPFIATAASPGKIRDLNGDGNLDVGNNGQDISSSEYFFARTYPEAGSTTPGAVAINGSLEFLIAQLTYTVTKLNAGGETDISFQPQPLSNGGAGAVWKQDNINESGLPSPTAPLVLIDPALSTPPVASNTTAYVKQNTPTIINPLAFDSSIASFDLGSVTFISGTLHGMSAVQPDGSVLFTPAAGYVGNDSFSYTVADSEGNISNAATVFLNVVAVAPPVAANVTASVPLDGSVAVNVLSSATAAIGTRIDASSVVAVTAPKDGAATVQPNGSILYTPRRGFLDTDIFSYTVKDKLGHISNVGTVTVGVTLTTRPTSGIFELPVVANMTTKINVLSEASASAGLTIDPTSIVISYHSRYGTAVPNADGSISYTPSAGYTGSDIVQYEISDSNGVQSQYGEIDANVEPATPVAKNFSVIAKANQPLSINVLGNVLPSFGATLQPGTLTANVQSPSLGTVGVISFYYPQYSTELVYKTSSYQGTDTIAYTVQDSSGQTSNTGYIMVNLSAGPPVANDDQASTKVGQPIDINVLANDLSSGATLLPASVTIVGQPALGNAVVQSDGTVLYTPSVSNATTDSFTYQVKDASGQISGAATVSISIKSNQLSGRIIGTAGSYHNGGATIANVFDGSLTSYFDAPTASGNWVGLDLGGQYTISQIGYAPRSGWANRMVGGVFQASNDPNFTTGVVSLATVTTQPPTGYYSIDNIVDPRTFEFVRYLSPKSSYGNIAEIQFFGLPVTTAVSQLTGNLIGTAGSYLNQGNTISNVFDGNLSTFSDAPAGSGAWAGLDLGIAKSISQISYAPRNGYAYRMVGGTFQASNSSDFSTGVVTMYTITNKPAANVLTTVAVNVTGTYRYVRYLGPDNTGCNISEAVFFG